MGISISCDTCHQSIPRGAGWKVSRISPHPAGREWGDPDGEYCSTICLAQAANRGRGQRPNFAAGRLKLESQGQS